MPVRADSCPDAARQTARTAQRSISLKSAAPHRLPAIRKNPQIRTLGDLASQTTRSAPDAVRRRIWPPCETRNPLLVRVGSRTVPASVITCKHEYHFVGAARAAKVNLTRAARCAAPFKRGKRERRTDTDPWDWPARRSVRSAHRYCAHRSRRADNAAPRNLPARSRPSRTP